MLRARAPLRIDLAGGWTDVPMFADVEGGEVVNVTVDRCVAARLGADGSVTLAHNVLAGGLGSSACEHVLREVLRDPEAERGAIAERAYRAECAEGVVGGRQDQYAACFGGLNYMTFGAAARTPPVEVKRIELPERTMRELEGRLVLVDSGVQRLSGAIHGAVWGGYARGEPGVAGALRSLRRCAGRMHDVLLTGELDAAPAIIAENWSLQKRLHSSVTNERVEAIFTVASRAGGAAGKACGAGGGGALVFCAPSTSGAEALRAALREAGITLIDFRFQDTGLCVEDGANNAAAG